MSWYMVFVVPLQGHLFSNLLVSEHDSLTWTASWYLTFSSYFVCCFSNLSCAHCSAGGQWRGEQRSRSLQRRNSPFLMLLCSRRHELRLNQHCIFLCSSADVLRSWHSRLVGRRLRKPLFSLEFISGSRSGSFESSQRATLHLGVWHLSRAQQPVLWVGAPFCQVLYPDTIISTPNSLGRLPKAWRIPVPALMSRRMSNKSWGSHG